MKGIRHYKSVPNHLDPDNILLPEYTTQPKQVVRSEMVLATLGRNLVIVVIRMAAHGSTPTTRRVPILRARGASNTLHHNLITKHNNVRGLLPWAKIGNGNNQTTRRKYVLHS